MLTYSNAVDCIVNYFSRESGSFVTGKDDRSIIKVICKTCTRCRFECKHTGLTIRYWLNKGAFRPKKATHEVVVPPRATGGSIVFVVTAAGSVGILCIAEWESEFVLKTDLSCKHVCTSANMSKAGPTSLSRDSVHGMGKWENCCIVNGMFDGG